MFGCHMTFNDTKKIIKAVVPKTPKHNKKTHSFNITKTEGRKRNVRVALQWRHSGRRGVSHHQPRDCLLNRLFKAHIKENIKAFCG